MRFVERALIRYAALCRFFCPQLPGCKNPVPCLQPLCCFSDPPPLTRIWYSRVGSGGSPTTTTLDSTSNLVGSDGAQGSMNYD
ncbi:hypothetical protein KC337_g31 [Hortaea werneckii]|nr:hypothetical protein KC337_g31 [Hortaea werneckii]